MTRMLCGALSDKARIGRRSLNSSKARILNCGKVFFYSF